MDHHPVLHDGAPAEPGATPSPTADPAVPEGRLSLREEQKRLTRRRILDGAVAVFETTSFAEATMEDIARAAGVTRVTVYAHFAGKTEIVQALVAHMYKVADEAYTDLATQPVWTRQAIRTWLEGATGRWRQMAPVVRALVAAGPTATGDGARDRSRAARERHVALLTDDLRRWRGTSPAEARQRALMAVLQTESFLAVWLAGEWPVATDDPLELLVDALCHLLAPALGERSGWRLRSGLIGVPPRHVMYTTSPQRSR
ncbi:TetR/AcrR family transcriptional regulator [Actinoallomurus vinaceus]|uniref:TetR/AcrR family transcriptional regulator n=1 Tax=Actinoallomurus vinaceus TaxID=1080074 RepID=UPI0031E764DA